MRRGGALVAVLLLIALLLVMALTQIARQPFQYRKARWTAGIARARALAEAGMEDFRVKWTHDLHFPPPPPDGSGSFTYSEEVLDFSTGVSRGTFRVTIDRTWDDPPYEVLRVSARGLAEGKAEYTIVGLWDLATEARPAGPGRLGQWIEWNELELQEP